MRSKGLQIIFHVILWGFLYLLPYLLYQGESNITTLFSHRGDFVHLLSTVLLIAFTYLNYFVLIPEFYLKRKYVSYFFLVVLGLLLAIWFPGLFHHIRPPMGEVPPGGMPPMGGGMPPHRGEPPLFFGRSYNIILFLVSVFVCLSLQIRLELMRIEKEKLNAELSFLKAQVNPHFLFNTLNSIYSLALAGSPETAASIVQLSGLMRYVLSDARADKVMLEKEMQFLENYVTLQQNRLGDTAHITFRVEGAPGQKTIAPLILISFVENAFKHGVNPESLSEITITASIKDSALTLFVRNRKVHVKENTAFSGIGMENTRSRLDHLYSGNYRLEVKEDETYYSVELIIQLDESDRA